MGTIAKGAPLRKSGIATSNNLIIAEVNDDDEERRQARKPSFKEVSTMEENETLKNCLQIFNENKLSKENAWSISLIDTLSTLLGKHHKSIKNFKVAGSTLEASSKVYGLRVDSVHTDVMRMCSGLNTQKFINEVSDNEENGINQDVQVQGDPEEGTKTKPKRKRRKLVSTITKNKETINAPLETHALIDPIFVKSNAVGGAGNSSNSLLLNCLSSADSELQRKMNAPFWDSKSFEDLTYLEEYDYSQEKSLDIKILTSIEMDSLILRPHFTDYKITNTPLEQGHCKNNSEKDFTKSVEDAFSDDNNNSQLALAFDINADIEPLPPDIQPFVDVDIDNFEELNVDEQTAITNCKGLRRTPIVIEDLRPIDSTSSNLEYSYRPLTKICQFWAGPSHWKFKASKNKSSLSLAQRFSSQITQLDKALKQKTQKKNVRFRPEHVSFGEVHDKLFKQLNRCKPRKINLRKFDVRKLKLPTDLKIQQNIFDVFKYAPGISVREDGEFTEILEGSSKANGFNFDQPADEIFETESNNHYTYENLEQHTEMPGGEEQFMDHTTLEIPSDFEGAPDKVIQIIVPFAKRAKVIDMKQLKKCCMLSIKNQIAKTNMNTNKNLPQFNGDEYEKGVATFSQTYKSLPKMLTENMAEALSPSVALYSILHLSNESNLRLVSQENLSDFQIYKLN